MCRQEKTAPDSLVGEVMGYGFFDSVFTKWGRDHEAAARRQYFNRMTKCHHPLTIVSECGLLVDTAHPYLSTSPDGLVSCPHCSPSRGVLEIKCPYTHRNETVEEACKDNTFCCRLVDGKVMLKRNHKYFSQVQGQMAITGRQWCDFVVWTMKEMTVERIVFDKEMWESSISKLRAFFLKGVVPEIFSRRVQRKLRLYQ
ncbi:hypothetical protein V1264_008751 [Littorina saxatilis]|uniref:YqaJ viral recombinase domain-containing protein n=1 Tax=Littorina saxatilis TaxID=31220 RepID=A0AAN9ATQ2_9CAEN